MTTVHGPQTAIDKFLPIYLESLRVDSVLDFDLHVQVGDEVVLYRAASLPFTEKTRLTLLENNVRRLYISADNRQDYQRYIETNVKTILEDPSIEESAKAGIVYGCAQMLVRDVLENPTLGENIQRSKRLVESEVTYILRGREAFYSLLKVMSFDYYTYTHSVNVCTFALALARQIGMTDVDELYELGSGALLHDVGKTRIAEAILFKPGPLTKQEFDTVRNHPRWGVDIIRETDLLSEDSYYPIIQHHERQNGSGYPNNLRGKDIHPFSRMVAIADVFDAMTTQRVYRSAVAAYPALKTMFNDDGAFDRELLEAFTVLMGPTDLADL